MIGGNKDVLTGFSRKQKHPGTLFITLLGSRSEGQEEKAEKKGSQYKNALELRTAKCTSSLALRNKMHHRSVVILWNWKKGSCPPLIKRMLSSTTTSQLHVHL